MEHIEIDARHIEGAGASGFVGHQVLGSGVAFDRLGRTDFEPFIFFTDLEEGAPVRFEQIDAIIGGKLADDFEVSAGTFTNAQASDIDLLVLGPANKSSKWGQPHPPGYNHRVPYRAAGRSL